LILITYSHHKFYQSSTTKGSISFFFFHLQTFPKNCYHGRCGQFSKTIGNFNKDFL